MGKLLFEVGYLHAMTGRSGGGGIDAERRHAPASIKGRLVDAKYLYFVEKRNARFSIENTASINYVVGTSRVLH